jgi:hypothetical protein
MTVRRSNTASIICIVTGLKKTVHSDRMVGRGEYMKKNLCRLRALMLFTLALSAATFAQDFGHTVRANIPFNFYAGGKVMPAGQYTLTYSRQNFNIAIYEKEKGFGTFLLGSPNDGTNDDRTLLVFRADDENIYVLQKFQGRDFGLSFSAGKRLSHLVEDRPANATQTVVAELVK